MRDPDAVHGGHLLLVAFVLVLAMLAMAYVIDHRLDRLEDIVLTPTPEATQEP